MENRWTLHVEAFGRIREADVTLAPLTLFVGDNNSGKSYLMELLYTLLTIRFYHQHYDFCQESEAYRRCADWLLAGTQCEKQEFPVRLAFTGEIRDCFIRLLNLMLEKNRKKISQHTFHAQVPIGKLWVEFPPAPEQELLIESLEEEGSSYSCRFSFPNTGYMGAKCRWETVDRYPISYILEYLLKRQFKSNLNRDVVFLPTSRTGFLLTYPSLVRASLVDTYDQGEHEEREGAARLAGSRLTQPCSDFLKNLSSIASQPSRSKYKGLVRFMETHIARGQYLISDTPLPSVTYRPQGGDRGLPMHLASGVVTELAPLLLLLEHHRPLLETLLMEEPEMGLHPELQTAMARVLIRLKNLDSPVFVSTHSDTILQHINNMIKLNGLPDGVRAELMEQFALEQEDLLDARDVAMYQYDVHQDGRTTTQRLSCSEYGFLVPTFINALERQLEVTRKTEPDVWEERDGE